MARALGNPDNESEKLLARSDERASPRVTLLLRTAKLIVDGREYLCLVRDSSNFGVKLQLFHPLPSGEDLVLEMTNGDQYPLELAWCNGNFVGLRFPEGIDFCRFILSAQGTHSKRQIRLNTELRGEIFVDNRLVDIKVDNISPQGACIKCDFFLSLDQMVAFIIHKFPTIFAKVRWRNRPNYGIIFQQPFRFEALAELLGRRDLIP